jgi:L-aspartate oxidase
MRSVIAPRDGSDISGRRISRDVAGDAIVDPQQTSTDQARDALQRTMTRDAGVLRTADTLARALSTARSTAVQAGLVPNRDRNDEELRNLATVAGAIAAAGLEREESRGAHTRGDFPERDDERFRVRLVAADASVRAGAS